MRRKFKIYESDLSPEEISQINSLYFWTLGSLFTIVLLVEFADFSAELVFYHLIIVFGLVWEEFGFVAAVKWNFLHFCLLVTAIIGFKVAFAAFLCSSIFHEVISYKIVGLEYDDNRPPSDWDS